MLAASLSETRSRQTQLFWFSILPIALLALGLRLHLLGDQSLWRDEIASVALARLPLSQIWGAWMVHETNPPLYYTLLHVWTRLFGEGEFAVRSLSALIGTIAVVCAGVLGRRLKSEQAGVIAALLMAVSALQVFYSQEARGYTLAATAALLSLIAVAELMARLTGASKPRDGLAQYGVWLLYIIATTAALYAHTTMVLLPLITNVCVAWLWIARGRTDVRFAVLWIGANLACVLLWSWWGWITVQQLDGTNPNIAWMAFPTGGIILRTAEHLYGLRRTGLSLMTLSAVTALLLIAAAIVGTIRMRHPAKWLLASAGFAVPLALLAISLYRPVFIERTVFWAQSAFLVLVAAGLCAIPRRAARLAAVAVVAAAFLADTVDSQRVAVKQPWREAVAKIKSGWREGDAVLVSSAAAGVFIEHYCRRLACDFPILALRNEGDEVTWAPDLFHGRTVDRRSLSSELHHYQRIWVPAEPGFNPRLELHLIAQQTSTVSLPFTSYQGQTKLTVSRWWPFPITDDGRSR
jgi:mannosyltransferase